MAKFSQGFYTPKFPQKYIGKGNIIYRSSWEFAFCRFCDNHPSIISWASESIRIPYRNPLSGKNTTYVPDFFIIYQDSAGQNHAELIEVKPSNQANLAEAKSARNKAAVAVNFAKWQAAKAFCSTKGITFRIITEKDLFLGGKK